MITAESKETSNPEMQLGFSACMQEIIRAINLWSADLDYILSSAEDRKALLSAYNDQIPEGWTALVNMSENSLGSFVPVTFFYDFCLSASAGFSVGTRGSSENSVSTRVFQLNQTLATNFSQNVFPQLQSIFQVESLHAGVPAADLTNALNEAISTAIEMLEAKHMSPAATAAALDAMLFCIGMMCQDSTLLRTQLEPLNQRIKELIASTNGVSEKMSTVQPAAIRSSWDAIMSGSSVSINGSFIRLAQAVNSPTDAASVQ